jgi:hypothetical protein
MTSQPAAARPGRGVTGPGSAHPSAHPLAHLLARLTSAGRAHRPADLGTTRGTGVAAPPHCGYRRRGHVPIGPVWVDHPWVGPLPVRPVAAGAAGPDGDRAQGDRRCSSYWPR